MNNDQKTEGFQEVMELLTKGGVGGEPSGLSPGWAANELPDEAKKSPGEDFTSHSKFFILWRPWWKCNRCNKKINDEVIILPPDEGDIDCPHTQYTQFKEIKDKCLEGPPYQLSRIDTFRLHDGTTVSQVDWFESKKKSK